MTLNFDPLKEKKEAISYGYDIKMPLQNKNCAQSLMTTTLFSGTLLLERPVSKQLLTELCFFGRKIFFLVTLFFLKESNLLKNE